jgi:nucleoside-diphosphate-sugar epimerase
MVGAGHDVAAVTRTADKIAGLRTAGVTPVLCDVYDRESLNAAVCAFGPDVILHQVTDLPDDLSRLAEFAAANNRARSEGTRNLLAAAELANAPRFVAQSIAWRTAGPIIEAHESAVTGAGGTVLRYGQFYGPGTYYEVEPPAGPRIHIDEAARRTMPFLAGPRGIFTVAEGLGR